VKKVAAKKVVTKKAPAKKVIAKKVTVKKTTVKKPLVNKAAPKKPPVKKTGAKKAAPAKVVAKKFVKTSKPVATAKPRAKIALKKPAAKKVAAVTKVKKPVAAVKAVIKTGMTKTAERKAKKLAQGKVAAPKKAVAVAAPVWPPMISAVLRQLDDAKAEEVVAMDLTGKSTIADTMIVATGRSNRHVNAIADQVIDELSKHGMKNIRIEGVPQCDWVLVDAGDVIVHVFRPEVRSFYNLEKLWAANIPE
jgi:ribosome-associated protein